MTDGPARTADWHARRAEDLTDLARSASMSGWWQRGRRRDLLAQAQIHATLGASAVVGADYGERLTLAESERDAADARAESLQDVGWPSRDQVASSSDMSPTSGKLLSKMSD